ncbi:AsmA_2 domain-containing protein, partial [Durusdinium trenchii]
MGWTPVSWDAIRSTLLWFLLLLIGAVAVGGAYAYHFWTRSDEFIDHAVRKKLAEIAPDWDIDFQSFQLTPEGRLDLLNVVVRPVSSNSPLARMPRVGVQLDRDLLLKHQRIVVRKVVLDEPEVLLIRTQNGEWNWHGARLPKPSDEGSPEWSIVDGRIRLRLEQPTGRPLEMEGENLRLTMLPEAYRRYRYRATGHFGPLGGLSVKGHFDGNTGEWFVAGAAGDIR